MVQIKVMVVDRCGLPKGYEVSRYEFFQGTPSLLLQEGDEIDLGDRVVPRAANTRPLTGVQVLFRNKPRPSLYCGLVYNDRLFAYDLSTDPQAYLKSLNKMAALPVEKVGPVHHTLDIQSEVRTRMWDAFRAFDAEKKLPHGRGTFGYGDCAVWL